MRLCAFAILALLIAASAARAHPHVWVDAASEVLFDTKGHIVAIRHHWRFDEAFSAYALQGLDVDRDGRYSSEELEPLAKENVESLSDFDFFTFLSVGTYRAGYGAPEDYYLELTDGRLLLHFTLPLAQPFTSKGTMLLEVFDPEYYVAFSLPNVEAVRLVGAPEACRLTVHPARELDAAAAQALATIGADQRELPPELKGLAAGTENSAEIVCGGSGSPQTATEAAAELARSGGETGDLRALPAEPDRDEAAAGASASASARPAPAAQGGLMARISAWQTAFNRDLTAALKGLKDGGAFWWLGGISFLYGIAHAAGPGHGKVVISSYLLANESRMRRGVVIAFLAAFAQAVVAIGLIGAMAVILNMTSMAITGTAKAFEAGSFALVALLGLYLLARKGRDAWAVVRASPSPLWGGARGGGTPAREGRAGHFHPHDHRSGQHATLSDPSPNPSAQGGGEELRHCHDHHVAPLDVKPGLSGAAAAILSVGIRPCSGALVVLVFALAQGVFWAGVASTFLMALGTAITVAALAALAVGAKGLARRLTRDEGRRSAHVMLGLELAAALFITALGAALFAGALYA